MIGLRAGVLAGWCGLLALLNVRLLASVTILAAGVLTCLVLGEDLAARRAAS